MHVGFMKAFRVQLMGKIICKDSMADRIQVTLGLLPRFTLCICHWTLVPICRKRNTTAVPSTMSLVLWQGTKEEMVVVGDWHSVAIDISGHTWLNSRFTLCLWPSVTCSAARHISGHTWLILRFTLCLWPSVTSTNFWWVLAYVFCWSSAEVLLNINILLKFCWILIFCWSSAEY